MVQRGKIEFSKNVRVVCRATIPQPVAGIQGRQYQLVCRSGGGGWWRGGGGGAVRGRGGGGGLLGGVGGGEVGEGAWWWSWVGVGKPGG